MAVSIINRLRTPVAGERFGSVRCFALGKRYGYFFCVSSLDRVENRLGDTIERRIRTVPAVRGKISSLVDPARRFRVKPL
jgi:hypothetical protein